MANFALNYSFSRNLNIPLDEDAVKQSLAEVVSYVATKSKCYAGQLFSVINPDNEEENGLYVAIKTGAEALVMRLASQEALDAVAASAGKIDKITLNGNELTINDKVVNIDLSDYATVSYVDGKIDALANVYAPKSEFEEVQKKVDEITSVGGEPNVQSDWNTTDEGADSFIKNKPDLNIYATKTALNDAQTTINENIDDKIEALANVYAAKNIVDTLVGDDSGKSARNIAAEEVAKIVASADTDFDTLKEVADWIANDTTGSAQMANDIASLKSISADTRLNTLEVDQHNHENKEVLDGISAEKVAAWDAAEQNAKDYADTKDSEVKSWVIEQGYLTEHQDISNLATKDEVATSEQNAKNYADAEIAKLSEVYDVKGAAASAKTEAIGIASAYTDTEIGKLGNVYDTKGSAEAAEGRAKTYADNEIGKLSEVYDAKGAAEAAEGRAKTYADSLAVNYDAAGEATKALGDAKAYADSLAVNYDAAGAAEDALTEAKAYADSLAVNYDAAGAAASAGASALNDAKNYVTETLKVYATKSYVDDVLSDLEGGNINLGGYAKIEDVISAVTESKNEAISTASAYTDTEIAKLSEVYDAKGAAASAKTEAIGIASAYTDTEIAKLSEVYASKVVVETLVGEDNDKSVRTVAAEEVAKVVAQAPEAYDTLEEIAKYIASDITSAATIVNDITDLKAIDADARLNALEAISGQSHVHDNKELLDTYTQTEEDLADAVVKKHNHENKVVLDGISAEKVAAWDAAEQSAKDYADTLVEDLEPYTGGTAVDIVDYTVNVKVSESDNNFLNVNENNELEVSGITLDAAVTSKEITIEGGQWADAVKTVYTGGTVPVGTTWESFLESMLCVEKFPGTISTTSAFTVSFGTLNPGIDKSGTVEVGTKVTLNKVQALDTTGHTQSITVGDFSGADGKVYGYKKGENGDHVNSKTYTETLTPILKSSSKALKVTFSGFSDAINSGSAITTKTAEGSIEAVTMYAMSGTNKVTVYQSGDTYTSSSAVTAGTLYAATNLKNYYKSDKITPNTYTPTCPSVDKQAKSSKEYSVTGAFKSFIGDVTSVKSEYDTYWDTDRSSIVRTLSTSDWATASTITKAHTFKVGTTQQTVVVPANYTSVTGKDVNNGDVAFNLRKTFDFTNAQGYISSYKVFVAPSLDGLGSDSTITITIK